VEILEKMLEVETKAKQIIETAKREADEIRKKAREDAKQLIIDGRTNLQDRLHQEIAQIEEEATERKKTILQQAEIRLAEMEHKAEEQMDSVVECVIRVLLKMR
jgi:vacuolar-type H+-ATPase subunit H